jgi:hypothetical protein
MDSFVSGLPKEEEFGPYNSERPKRPACACAVLRLDFSSTNVVILLQTQLIRELKRWYHPMADCSNMRVWYSLGWIESDAFEPAIQAVD